MLLKPIVTAGVLTCMVAGVASLLAAAHGHSLPRELYPCRLCSLIHATAEQKDEKPALSGSWAQQGGKLRIDFIDKDTMKISPHGQDEVILIVCSYTVDKDKGVKAKITELEGKEKEKAKEIIPVGLEFSFKWQPKDGTATVSDVEGKNTDSLKTHLEGKYEKK